MTRFVPGHLAFDRLRAALGLPDCTRIVIDAAVGEAVKIYVEIPVDQERLDLAERVILEGIEVVAAHHVAVDERGRVTYQ